jgi:hypothetical protein
VGEYITDIGPSLKKNGHAIRPSIEPSQSMMPLVHHQYRHNEGDDYLARHRQGKLHAGIAYGHPPALQIGEDF